MNVISNNYGTVILIADEDKVIIDKQNTLIGKTIYLGCHCSVDDYKEITMEEYETMHFLVDN